MAMAHSRTIVENRPAVSTASLKKAMIDVADALAESALASRVLLQIHDELLLEIAPGEAEAVEELVSARMSGAAQLSVPLDVSVGRGATWRAAAH